MCRGGHGHSGGHLSEHQRWLASPHPDLTPGLRVTSASSDQVFSQVPAALGPVPRCGVGWAGPGWSLSSGWGEQNRSITKADLSPPYVGSASTRAPQQRGVQASPALPSVPAALRGTRGLSPTCRTPGLGCPVCGSHDSLPRAGVGPAISLFL